MAKKLHFAILFLALHLIPSSVFASGEPTSLTLNCTAPPPDSVRVTSMGHNFVTVSWNPTAPGDDHRLTVYQGSSSTLWAPLYSVDLVNATSYTVNNLVSGLEYRVGVQTMCAGGEPGDSVSYTIPFQGVILDLVLGGRTPIEPKTVACENINYLDPDNEWVGFRLTKEVEGEVLASSLFEFEAVEGEEPVVARIKRVEEDNILVAANLDNYWPTSTAPIIIGDLLFQAGEVIDQWIFDGFGHIILTLNSFPTVSLDLCPCIDQCQPTFDPWDNNYKFETLVAQDVETPIDGPYDDNESNRSMKKDSTLIPIKVQSPFSENLNVFFPENSFVHGLYNINVFDINGNVTFQEQINIQEPQISIPVGRLSPGFYIVRIESNGIIENLKALKVK